MPGSDEGSTTIGKKLASSGLKQEECCCSAAVQTPGAAVSENWSRFYWLRAAFATVLWLGAYFLVEPASSWIVRNLPGIGSSPHLGEAIEFFLYDAIKILLLLVGLIYVIAWLRAALNIERAREYLKGKKRILGYFLGALFGSVTPFCSCSSIPLFIGFATARIPFGVTMAFLVTSPLVNEIAVVLLWGLLGWKFTVIYVIVGMAAGMLGGLLMDILQAERWLQPFIIESSRKIPLEIIAARKARKMTAYQRHSFAWGETCAIFRKVWLWVIIGVGIGAALHGFVPDDWFARHFGAGEWWTVPAAVLVAIPLYSNVTGIVPIMESLLMKGLPLGTTLAFCMSAVAASIPEVMLLRRIMTIRLQIVFIAYLWVIFTLIGWLFNLAAPHLA